jgi:hypothetical protein
MQSMCGFADDCVIEVKAEDPFCACTEWDSICIAAWEACSPR